MHAWHGMGVVKICAERKRIGAYRCMVVCGYSTWASMWWEMYTAQLKKVK